MSLATYILIVFDVIVWMLIFVTCFPEAADSIFSSRLLSPFVAIIDRLNGWTQDLFEFLSAAAERIADRIAGTPTERTEK